MANPDIEIPEATDLKGPARDFVRFCTTERQRRENSNCEFDVELFDEAVRLILAKLAGRAEEGS